MAESIVAMRAGSEEQLPARVRFLLAGDVITAVGLGLTQPYLLVLLHETYGLSIATATATMSLSAIVSLVGNPLSGVFTDRYGGKLTMLAGLAIITAGLFTLGSGRTGVAAVAGVALTGLGWSLILPALATLIVTGLGESGRSRVFTLQYALLNAGMGSGAAIGAVVIAGDHRLADLPVLWFLAAGSCVASALLVSTVRFPSRTGTEPRPRAQTGYRSVLTRGPLWNVLTIAVGLSAAGYGVYTVGPAVVAFTAHDPAAVSWVATINCATVVLGLPAALRLGRRLTPYAALRATAATWSVAWALCIAQVTGFGPGARLSLAVAATLIGAGELLMASALPTMVNAIAPEPLRGRYNALLTFAMTVGVWVGPALASLGSFVGHGVLLFVAALAILAGASLLLRRPMAVMAC